MRVRFIVPVKVLNPAWSQADADQAHSLRKPYDVPQFLDVSPGYEVEDPMAWIHCCPGDLNAAPRAEAVDDEARAKVHEWMTIHRPAGIAQIKAQLDQIDMIKNPQDRERLLAMGKAYGLIGSDKKLKPSKPEPSAPTET